MLSYLQHATSLPPPYSQSFTILVHFESCEHRVQLLPCPLLRCFVRRDLCPRPSRRRFSNCELRSQLRNNFILGRHFSPLLFNHEI